MRWRSVEDYFVGAGRTCGTWVHSTSVADRFFWPLESFRKCWTILGGLLAVLILSSSCALPQVIDKRPSFRARVGNLVITNDNTIAQKELLEFREAWPTRQSQRQVEQFASLTQVEATKQIGFPVLVPKLPEDRWKEDYLIISNGRVVVMGRFDELVASIAQWHITDEDFKLAVGTAEIREIEVRNSQGLWIEGSPAGLIGGGGSAFALSQDDIEWQLADRDIIAWEEDGIVYLISGDDEFRLEQMLELAESLGK